MTTLAVTNAGAVLTGDLDAPTEPDVDTVICRDGTIAAVGTARELAGEMAAADQVIDAAGTTVAPGLIDSHCHVVLGDYTPRQKTVDFLASYVHGGITSAVSPGEIHAPGRPKDAIGVKALAIAARACFAGFQPGGMRVHAGSLVIEPTLTEADMAEVAAAGVRFAKFGFGAFADPGDGEPQVRWAQAHGLLVMCHSGGASIPGSKPVSPDHLLHLRPDVCGHINGGPTALDPKGVERVVRETDMALQLVQAGNFRAAVEILELARSIGVLERVVIGSDTPTGTGVMPLGVLKTIAELSSWTGLHPAVTWALATGNNARIFGVPGGRLRAGEAADMVVMDAPWGSGGATATEALALGDVPGISAVVIDGEIRAMRSRNTPAAARMATLRHGVLTPSYS